jgi:hypothetical protein
MWKFLSCDKGGGAVEYVIAIAIGGLALSIGFPDALPGLRNLAANAIAAWR